MNSILFDLDETLHYSEEHLKTPSWNHLLSPWGWVWKLQDNQCYEGFQFVQDKQRPERGINPHQFIGRLIETLGLELAKIGRSDLEVAGFQPQNIEALLRLKERSSDEDNLTAKMTKILFREWATFLVNRVKQEGVVPVPGAAEMVKRFHEAGYKIGVVTQAPQKYAQEVLKCLGLWTPKRDERIVDVIVSGEMVRKPKPDPEPLMLANWLLGWKEQLACALAQKGAILTREERAELAKSWWRESMTTHRPKAYIGDTRSDVEAGVAFGIPVIIIRGEGTDPEQLRELGAALVVKHPDEVMPDILEKEPFLYYPREVELELNPPFRFKER